MAASPSPSHSGHLRLCQLWALPGRRAVRRKSTLEGATPPSLPTKPTLWQQCLDSGCTCVRPSWSSRAASCRCFCTSWRFCRRRGGTWGRQEAGSEEVKINYLLCQAVAITCPAPCTNAPLSPGELCCSLLLLLFSRDPVARSWLP